MGAAANVLVFDRDAGFGIQLVPGLLVDAGEGNALGGRRGRIKRDRARNQ